MFFDKKMMLHDNYGYIKIMASSLIKKLLDTVRHLLKRQRLKFNYLYRISFLISFKLFHTDVCIGIAKYSRVEFSSS